MAVLVAVLVAVPSVALEQVPPDKENRKIICLSLKRKSRLRAKRTNMSLSIQKSQETKKRKHT